MDWIDNADSYICPICGKEISSPIKYLGCMCPSCGFHPDRDIKNYIGIATNITDQAIEFESYCMDKALSRWQIKKEDVLARIQEADKLHAELEQMKRENNALWTYIEIVDREYRKYMDIGYIDRLDELKREWKHEWG